MQIIRSVFVLFYFIFFCIFFFPELSTAFTQNKQHFAFIIIIIMIIVIITVILARSDVKELTEWKKYLNNHVDGSFSMRRIH